MKKIKLFTAALSVFLPLGISSCKCKTGVKEVAPIAWKTGGITVEEEESDAVLRGIVVTVDNIIFAADGESVPCLCVYLPLSGITTIPSCETVVKQTAEGAVENYSLKEGDLIALSFSDPDFFIIDTFPGHIAGRPEKITCYAEGLDIDYDIESYRNFYSVSFPLSRLSGSVSEDRELKINCGERKFTARVFSSGKNTVALLIPFEEINSFLDNYNVFTVS